MKDQRITIRVSEEERERIERAAANDHRTVSDWIRLTVMKTLKEEKKMLTEKRLIEIMEEEVEKVISLYEGNKEEFRISAIEAVDPLNESTLTEEEVRKIYRDWLEESIRA